MRGCALLSDARAVSMHWFIRVSMFSISSACGGPDAHLMHTVRAARACMQADPLACCAYASQVGGCARQAGLESKSVLPAIADLYV